MTGGASVSSGNSDRWEEREGELLRKKKGTFSFVVLCISAAFRSENEMLLYLLLFLLAWDGHISFLLVIVDWKVWHFEPFLRSF